MSGPTTAAGIVGAWARYLRAGFLDFDAEEIGARLGLSAVAVLQAESPSGPGPSREYLQALLDLRVDALARGACCALRWWTVEEMWEAAEAEAARPAKTGTSSGRAA